MIGKWGWNDGVMEESEGHVIRIFASNRCGDEPITSQIEDLFNEGHIWSDIDHATTRTS